MKTIQILIALINKQKRYPDDRESFVSKLKNSFGGDAIMIPLPDNAPIEIPSITLTEKDKFEIRVSKARTDLILIGKKDEETELIDSVISNLEELLRIFQDEQIDFKQIGYLIQTTVEGANPNEKVKKLVNTSNDKLSEIFDFSEQSEILIRNLRKKELVIDDKTLITNSIIQVTTNVKTPEGEVLPILIDYDTNTFPMEEDDILETETLKGFIEKVNTKQQDEVKKLIDALSKDGTE